MQQIFNLIINIIIIESSSTNNLFEMFHFVENDNRISVDTKLLFENELNLVTANRIFINKFVNYLFVQWDNNNYENYALWSIIHDEFENWITIHFDNWISKFETIWETSATFAMFESIIISNLIASKSASCWTLFNTIEMMNEHRIKSNELRIDSKLRLESSENENMNSTTFLISTT
jgi:hypothetical protein